MQLGYRALLKKAQEKVGGFSNFASHGVFFHLMLLGEIGPVAIDMIRTFSVKEFEMV